MSSLFDSLWGNFLKKPLHAKHKVYNSIYSNRFGKTDKTLQEMERKYKIWSTNNSEWFDEGYRKRVMEERARREIQEKADKITATGTSEAGLNLDI